MILSYTVLYLTILLLPALGFALPFLTAYWFRETWYMWISIGLVAGSFALSCWVFWQHYTLQIPAQNIVLYEWIANGSAYFSIGMMIDFLSLIMMIIVTGISTLVHLYSVGYMKEDAAKVRFFSYISLFTCIMLVLVMSNNFVQLFFAWEGVGLVSYLLIGFWFKKPSATYASLKAFLVNRVSDMAFIVAIGLIFFQYGSLMYADIWLNALQSNHETNTFLIGVLLLIGAMGKSAQMPLHVWLPDSMEGPTPISALIHAATMVTAGIFMIARHSVLFEQAAGLGGIMLIIGTLTAILMGVVGLLQNDIKRIVAYSTLSQLGYMMAALGVSAYSVAIFHLATHAFFKALLFLGAGGVIVAMHHVQDIKRFGGLAEKLPLLTTAMILGSMALMGVPGFSGFFSKDLILEAVRTSTLPFAMTTYYLLVVGVFITTMYSMRLLLLTFFGKPADNELLTHFKKPSWHIQVPVAILAVLAIFSGTAFFEFMKTFSSINAIFSTDWLAMNQYTTESLITHTLSSLPTFALLLGVLTALLHWNMTQNKTHLDRSENRFILFFKNGYGIDALYRFVFIRGTQKVSVCFAWLDNHILDERVVMFFPKAMSQIGALLSKLQTGHLGDYLLVTIILATFSIGIILL